MAGGEGGEAIRAWDEDLVFDDQGCATVDERTILMHLGSSAVSGPIIDLPTAGPCKIVYLEHRREFSLTRIRHPVGIALTASVPEGDGYSRMEVQLPSVGTPPKMLSVPFGIGSAVTVGGDVPGVVTGIAIYETGVKYLVAWWQDRNRNEEWLNEREIQADSAERQVIGFKETGGATS